MAKKTKRAFVAATPGTTMILLDASQHWQNDAIIPPGKPVTRRQDYAVIGWSVMQWPDGDNLASPITFPPLIEESDDAFKLIVLPDGKILADGPHYKDP